MRRLLPLTPLVTSVSSLGQTAAPEDNLRLTALFDADQHDRMPPAGQAIDWSRIGPADTARQREVRAMLDSGAVRTGIDYWHPAFIYRHGGTPNDFLLPHTLTKTAMAKRPRGHVPVTSEQEAQRCEWDAGRAGAAPRP